MEAEFCFECCKKSEDAIESDYRGSTVLHS